MHFSFEAIIYYFIVIDALVAMFIAWSGRASSVHDRSGMFSRFFPLTRGWTMYYLILVIWLGFALSRLNVI